MAGAVPGRSRLPIPLPRHCLGEDQGPSLCLPKLALSSPQSEPALPPALGAGGAPRGTHNSHPIFCPREQEGALPLPLPNDRYDVGRRNSRSSSPWVGGRGSEQRPPAPRGRLPLSREQSAPLCSLLRPRPMKRL